MRRLRYELIVNPLPDTDNTGVGRFDDRLGQCPSINRTEIFCAVDFIFWRYFMKSQSSTAPVSRTRRHIRILCECGVMIALSTVLSLLAIIKFPWGGSVTLRSMRPVMLIAMKYSTGVGLAAAFVYSLTQLGLDLANRMSWGMTPGVWAGCLAFDYIVAFSVLGLAGLWRKKGLRGIVAGAILSISLRYVCHVISGWIFFGQYAWEGWSVLPYSLCYNGAYMLPEMIFTTVAAIILFRIPTMSKLLTE